MPVAVAKIESGRLGMPWLNQPAFNRLREVRFLQGAAPEKR